MKYNEDHDGYKSGDVSGKRRLQENIRRAEDAKRAMQVPFKQQYCLDGCKRSSDTQNKRQVKQSVCAKKVAGTAKQNCKQGGGDSQDKGSTALLGALGVATNVSSRTRVAAGTGQGEGGGCKVCLLWNQRVGLMHGKILFADILVLTENFVNN